jgi:hypothetical protein
MEFIIRDIFKCERCFKECNVNKRTNICISCEYEMKKLTLLTNLTNCKYQKIQKNIYDSKTLDFKHTQFKFKES